MGKFKALGILPVRGRKDQTIINVERLINNAPLDKLPWKLVAVSGNEDKDIVKALEPLGAISLVNENKPKLTYWEALKLATDKFDDFPLLVNLANDLLASPDWLLRAVQSFIKKFEYGQGMIGFNGDGFHNDHACHFVIHRELLNKYGGWPTIYNHNYGDRELVERAKADNLFYKEPYAVLFHNHPYHIGKKYDDEVYREGRLHNKNDKDLYNIRVSLGFPDK